MEVFASEEKDKISIFDLTVSFLLLDKIVIKPLYVQIKHLSLKSSYIHLHASQDFSSLCKSLPKQK